MKTLITTWCFFLFTQIVVGQTAQLDKWYDGYLVLTNRDTLEGKINYLSDSDIIRLKQGEVTKTYTPLKLRFVHYYDQYLKRDRNLVVYKYKKISDYAVPTLFEVMIDTAYLDLLYRQYITQVLYNNIDPMTGLNYPYYVNEVKTDYFLRKNDGDIVNFSGGRKEFLNYIGEYKDAVKKYIKKHKLRLSKRADLIKAITFFNNLKASNG